MGDTVCIHFPDLHFLSFLLNNVIRGEKEHLNLILTYGTLFES